MPLKDDLAEMVLSVARGELDKTSVFVSLDASHALLDLIRGIGFMAVQKDRVDGIILMP